CVCDVSLVLRFFHTRRSSDLSESVCEADFYTFEFENVSTNSIHTRNSNNYVAFLNGVTPALTPGDYNVQECNIVVRVACVDAVGDRKSTRLNSSHVKISYAVF